MTKREIAKRLARQSRVTRATAADQLDQIVHEILSNLRHGKSAPLPGLGQFSLGPKGVYHFKPDGSPRLKKEKPARDGRK
jgi:nucleoid DNA-binding protein